MNSKIITVVKRTTSALIIVLALCAICIPAVAVTVGKPGEGSTYTYFLRSSFGGKSEYGYIYQFKYSSGNSNVMMNGTNPHMELNGKKAKFECEIKLETFKNMTSDITYWFSTPLKFSFYKKNGITWSKIALKDSDNKSYTKYAVSNSASISRVKSSSTYGAKYLYANLYSGDYAFKVFTDEVPPIYQDYMNIYFQSDIFRAS